MVVVAEPISRKKMPSIANYLQHLNQRDFADAERELETIGKEMKTTPWHKGYCNALEGMFISLKSNDSRYLYISRVNLDNEKKLDELQRQFARMSKSSLQEDFDRGFFAAWVEYLKILRSSRSDAKSLNGYLK
ncbi:MAG: hypothetical protein QG670_1349 [Thermoproteota archaeon]|nr:hypothetical protein [Thermoproteota archaeon]